MKSDDGMSIANPVALEISVKNRESIIYIALCSSIFQVEETVNLKINAVYTFFTIFG